VARRLAYAHHGPRGRGHVVAEGVPLQRLVGTIGRSRPDGGFRGPGSSRSWPTRLCMRPEGPKRATGSPSCSDCSRRRRPTRRGGPMPRGCSWRVSAASARWSSRTSARPPDPAVSHVHGRAGSVSETLDGRWALVKPACTVRRAASGQAWVKYLRMGRPARGARWMSTLCQATCWLSGWRRAWRARF